jgi:hypothetical protein
MIAHGADGGADPLRDAGLAVGAGDGDQRQALARAPVDGVRQRPAQRAQTADRQIGDPPVAAPGEGADPASPVFPEDGAAPLAIASAM